MDSSLIELFVICFAMFAGAFIAGLSCYKLNRRQLSWLNCFAAGLLLGTALAVIIPEGVHSLYQADEKEHHHDNNHHEGEHKEEEELEGHSLHTETLLGWTLLLGFLTMMIADDAFASCTGGHHGHSHNNEEVELEDTLPTTNTSTSTPNKNSSSSSTAIKNDVEENSNEQNVVVLHEKHEVVSQQRRRNTVTFGLLIHNGMDGLAMGAAKAAISSSAATQTVVFWAIMMHHVPAAFGYATYLRNSGLEEHFVRRYVIIFSLAAPIVACITFLILHPSFFGFFTVTSKAVGLCLLFSGGTFLNVACVHALDEAKRGFPKWGTKQILVLALGSIVPGIASWNHEH